MEKLYKVSSFMTYKMDYIVEAASEMEAKWLVEYMTDNGDVIGCDYNQKCLGDKVFSVKQVSSKKAVDLIRKKNGITSDTYSERERLEAHLVRWGITDEIALGRGELHFDDEAIDDEGKM